MTATLDERDTEIRQRLIDSWDADERPRVGSWIKFADGSYWRMSYDWGDSFQYSIGGSFHLSMGGYASFSGGLEPSVKHDLKPLEEFRKAKFWFFSHQYPGAGRGVGFDFLVRVYKHQDTTLTPAIDKIRRTYTVVQLYKKDNRQSHGGYQYLIEEGGTSVMAFRTTTEFHGWLRVQGLEVTAITYEDPGDVRCMDVGPKNLQQALYDFNTLRDKEALG